jgi:hypothetical protein
LEISWQNVFIGALALAGTTTLAIIVTRLVNWALDHRSQLIVEVRVNAMFNAKKLFRDVRDDVRKTIVSPKTLDSLELWEKLPFGFDGNFSNFFDNETYLQIALTNNTRKKLTGLTMSLDRVGSSMIQIGSDGEIIQIPGRVPSAIVDLQPGRTIKIDLLTSFFPISTDGSLKKAIVFSSDEHVRVQYRFPPPDYVAFRLYMRRRLTYFILFNVVLIGGFVALIALSKQHG